MDYGVLGNNGYAICMQPRITWTKSVSFFGSELIRMLALFMPLREYRGI